MLEVKIQHSLPFLSPSPAPQVPWGGPPQSAVPEGDRERLVREGEQRVTLIWLAVCNFGGQTCAAPRKTELPDNVQLSPPLSPPTHPLMHPRRVATLLFFTRCCWGRWTLAWAPPRWWWRSSRPAPACTSRCTSWRRLNPTGNFHSDRKRFEVNFDVTPFSFKNLFSHCDIDTFPSSAPQYSPASCSAKVLGPVHWGHSLPAGNGVLPTGEFHI